MMIDQRRTLLPGMLLLFLGMSGCSSGLGDPKGNPNGELALANVNVRFGFDPGFELTDPVTESRVAGAVLSAGTGDRPLVFFVFSTAAAADNADGSGGTLEREAGAAEGNTGTDIFVAIVSSDEVGDDAFMQTLAQKFRHPRCVTCHSMNSADSVAFLNSAHPGGQPPLNLLDNSQCRACHINVDDWRAPPAFLDFRKQNMREIFNNVINPPPGIIDIAEHFSSDPRVLWALGDGTLPQGNVADDDRDGVSEPEDSDRVNRTVPGGISTFRAQLARWLAGGQRFNSNDDALKDILLVSRATGTTTTGDAPSSAPRVTFIANPNFPGTDPVRFGTLFVTYASDATNLVGGDTNGFSDIFRAEIAVNIDQDPATGASSTGDINLAFVSTVRVSLVDGGTGESDGDSFNPVVSSDGNTVAFESLATTLVAGFANVNPARDIFLRDIANQTTLLVSRSTNGSTSDGNGGSFNPSLSPGGDAVAFESAATDLINTDTNGQSDIFYALVSGGAVTQLDRASVDSSGAEGTGGDCRNPSIFVLDFAADDVLVAFESEKRDLVDDLSPMSTTNVFLHRTGTEMFTALLNQRVDATGTHIGAVDAGAGAVDSFSPVIGPGGTYALYSSNADNLDARRPDDLNRTEDIFLVSIRQFLDAGLLVPLRLSVTLDGGDANAASASPAFGTFSGNTDFSVGFASFQTQANNLGTTSDMNNSVVLFLEESAGPIANFTATPVNGVSPLMVDFTNTSSDSPLSFEWDFGDGSMSTEENPSHTYTASGRYTVSLSVEGPAGPASVTKTDVIAVFGPVDTDFTADVSAPQEVPVTVQFTDTSTGAPTSWEWDFGDGNTSTQQSPQHKYLEAGDFTVTLTATGFFNDDTETKTNFIISVPATLSSIKANVFATSCSTCHSGGTEPDLNTGTASQVHGRIVNVNSNLCGSGFPYIVQDGDDSNNDENLEDSFLYQLIAVDFATPDFCGLVGVMPQNRAGPFDEDKVAKIRSWILDGAPNN